MSVEVHTGFWIDHSKGAVLGSVLTYKASYGNQLITAAALVIAIAGSALWSIIGFIIHQRICREPNQDELDAQLRVVVKNGGPPDAVSTLISMGHTWHGKAKSAWTRTLLFMLPPLFIFLSFTVAGIVVSYIALDPDDSPALLKAGNCGIVTQNAKAVAVQGISNSSIVAAAYVRDCYSKDSTGAVACSTFNKPTLPYTVVRNASCPLGHGRCQNGDNQAINLTTILDSHDDLGVNAEKGDRVQYGYNAVCAPLSYDVLSNHTNHTHRYDIRADNLSYTFSSVTVATGYPAWNYTNLTREGFMEVSAYTMSPYKSYWPHDGSYGLGTAVPPFNQTLKDVTIALINTNGMHFLQQSNDSIFATSSNDSITVPNYATLYPLKHQASAIVCTDTYKICNGPNLCTDWVPFPYYGSRFTGANSTTLLTEQLKLNTAQNATMYRIFWGFTDNISVFGSMFTPNALRATDYMLGGLIASRQLPNDQWAREVETWYQIGLAKMQYLAKLYPNVPPSYDDASGFQIYAPDGRPLITQCSQQRIQIPAGYQNFSVFGLCFVFLVSLVMLLIAILLSCFHHKLPGRKEGQPKRDKLLAYQADGYLQLHRAAMELAGHGGWYGAHDGKTSVPYTKRAERILTRESLVYRAGSERERAEGLEKGGNDLKGTDSDGSSTAMVVDDGTGPGPVRTDTGIDKRAKIISGSWNGTGITSQGDMIR